MSNKISVDRGDLFAVLLAAEAALKDPAERGLHTLNAGQIEDTARACEDIREELLA